MQLYDILTTSRRVRETNARSDKIRHLAACLRHAELFPHGADIGVRGIGPTRDAAFEQAAFALSSAITDPARIALQEAIEVTCEAPDDAYLLLDWLNALIYEMAARRLVLGRFAVFIEGNRLYGRAWGESVDHARHMPAVEPKGRH